MLTSVFVTMTYSATMPLMNVICLVSLFLLYGANKLFILRFHDLPPAYSVDLPKVFTRLLYGAALLHACFGAWMFGNKNFYAPDYDHREAVVSAVYTNSTATVAASFLVSSHSWTAQTDWLARITGPQSILLLAIAVLIGAVLVVIGLGLLLQRLFGFRPIEWLQTSNTWLKTRQMERDLPPYFETLPVTLLRQRMLAGTLNGRLREKYKTRLSRLVNNEASLPERVMEGLESYKLSLSPEYSYKFGLDSYYLRRIAPTDWLVSSDASADKAYLATLHSGNRNSARGSFTTMFHNAVSLKDEFSGSEAFEDRIDGSHLHAVLLD